MVDLWDTPEFQRMAEKSAERVRLLKERMRFRDMGPLLAESWEYLGLRCGIGGTHLSGCGYVQLPPPLRHVWSWYDEIPYEEIEAHGGLTYGVDGAGWIGFDTSHLGDYWEVEALAPLLDRLEYEELLHVREIYEQMPGGSVWERHQARSWTIPLLKGATMELAASVFALEPPRMLQAGPTRLQLTAGTPATRRSNLRDGDDTQHAEPGS